MIMIMIMIIIIIIIIGRVPCGRKGERKSRVLVQGLHLVARVRTLAYIYIYIYI